MCRQALEHFIVMEEEESHKSGHFSNTLVELIDGLQQIGKAVP